MQSPGAFPWLKWGAQLKALSQTGLTYARDPYDVDRYHTIGKMAAEMIAAGSGAAVETVQDLLGKDSGHPTPKVDVRGVVFRDNKILLVRERAEGRWSLPGGWADLGESAAESVVREIFEETGLETRCKKLLAVFDRDKHPQHPPYLFHVYKMFILCEIVGGELTTSFETDQVEFFSENALPEISTGRVTSWQVCRMFEHLRNPDMPADFD